jgi:hypothetical protein
MELEEEKGKPVAAAAAAAMVMDSGTAVMEMLEMTRMTRMTARMRRETKRRVGREKSPFQVSSQRRRPWIAE